MTGAASAMIPRKNGGIWRTPGHASTRPARLSISLYGCWKYILKNVAGIKTEAEARMSIVDSSSGHISRKERSAKFKYCVERVAENYPRVTSRSEKMKLARDYMQKLF